MKTRHLLFALLFLFAAPTQAWAKRLPPPAVKPVEHEGVRYTAPNDSGERGIVKAYDVKTEKLLWEKTAFKVTIDPELERDVQWIFIKSMAVKDDALVVIDERGRSHRIDLKEPNDNAPPAKLSELESLNATRQIAMACHMFAVDNRGKLPASLEDLVGYLDKRFDLRPFELVTKGVNISKLEDPASAVLVQTKESWDGKRVAAFLDGHAGLVPVKPDPDGDK